MFLLLAAVPLPAAFTFPPLHFTDFPQISLTGMRFNSAGPGTFNGSCLLFGVETLKSLVLLLLLPVLLVPSILHLSPSFHIMLGFCPEEGVSMFSGQPSSANIHLSWWWFSLQTCPFIQLLAHKTPFYLNCLFLCLTKLGLLPGFPTGGPPKDVHSVQLSLYV